MGKIRVIALSEKQRETLEDAYRTGKTHAFRKNCQLVLLKSEGLSSKQVGHLLKINPVTVNSWLDRYESEGLQGLHIKSGRGRKRTFDTVKHTPTVRKVVQQERQRLSQAKLLLEQELKKQFSLKTLKRFLKKLAVDTRE